MNTIVEYIYSCMPAPRPLGFPPGKTLPEELCTAMKRIEASGVVYPDGYYQTVLEKYTKEGVCYPHILMAIGQPRINNHFFYPCDLKGSGRLLDYGCGTGCNVRQLIRDGFPRERITAFDITWASINLGFDLYCDQEKIHDLFTVSEMFPFGPAEFDMVYSARVLHVIADDEVLKNYLANAWSTLKPGGILFGSTAGQIGEGGVRSLGEWRPPRMMTKDQLTTCLTGAGFNTSKIVQRHHDHHHIAYSDICVFEFCAKKPA
jgi:SAM-dependent methyltransferase